MIRARTGGAYREREHPLVPPVPEEVWGRQGNTLQLNDCLLYWTGRALTAPQEYAYHAVKSDGDGSQVRSRDVASTLDAREAEGEFSAGPYLT